MLIEFSFENFTCYKGQACLQMAAASIEEHADSLIEGVVGRKIVPVAAIYGPNGGGKSSVLQAFDALRSYLILPDVLFRRSAEKAPVVACKPYAFDVDSAEEPTTFCAIFETGGYEYRYILSISDGVVVEEYLHRKKPGRGVQATLFERADSGVLLGSTLKRKGINTDVDTMMPFFSFLAINYDLDVIEEPFDWFRNCQVLDYSAPLIEEYYAEPKTAEGRAAVVDMLNRMDIGIDDIRFQHGRDNELEGIFLKHAGMNGRELELAEESNGTQKLISLVPRIIVALRTGSLVVSDELDAKLHPKLLKYLVRLFTDKRTNPHGAQLIFTSHDTSTMNSSMFRRDEIWFAAHTEEGPSTLYSLADIADVDGKRIRTRNAYDRQYLEGRYGADPYLANMLEWGGADE